MKRRHLRCGVVLLAAFLAVGVLSHALAAQDRKGKPKEPEPPKRTLLLFPFDFPNANIKNAPEVMGLLADVARSRLLLTRTYAVTPFRRGLPTVARLHGEQQLTDSDITPPFAEDNIKAVKIAKLIDYEVVFVGSIDSYAYNDADRQVEITISGRLVEVDPKATSGKVLRSATLTATSEKGGRANEEERAMEAARSAGEKLMAQLVPLAPASQKPEEEKKPETQK